MQIEKISIDKLKPYENNAKQHTAEQIEQIKSSIIAFGNNDPIGIGVDNVIIEGHGRYIALKELGYEEVYCIRLDHLTEEERKAYALAHNKLTMNTSWDFDILNAELENLDELLDMSQFGFYDSDENYLDNLFDEPQEKKEDGEGEKENEKQPEKTEYFVIVRFDTDEELDNFIEYCEQQAFNYERGA